MKVELTIDNVTYVVNEARNLEVPDYPNPHKICPLCKDCDLHKDGLCEKLSTKDNYGYVYICSVLHLNSTQNFKRK